MEILVFVIVFIPRQPYSSFNELKTDAETEYELCSFCVLTIVLYFFLDDVMFSNLATDSRVILGTLLTSTVRVKKWVNMIVKAQENSFPRV